MKSCFLINHQFLYQHKLKAKNDRLRRLLLKNIDVLYLEFLVVLVCRFKYWIVHTRANFFLDAKYYFFQTQFQTLMKTKITVGLQRTSEMRLCWRIYGFLLSYAGWVVIGLAWNDRISSWNIVEWKAPQFLLQMLLFFVIGR